MLEIFLSDWLAILASIAGLIVGWIIYPYTLSLRALFHTSPLKYLDNRILFSFNSFFICWLIVYLIRS